jgi:hypothetical protein
VRPETQNIVAGLEERSGLPVQVVPMKDLAVVSRVTMCPQATGSYLVQYRPGITFVRGLRDRLPVWARPSTTRPAGIEKAIRRDRTLATCSVRCDRFREGHDAEHLQHVEVRADPAAGHDSPSHLDPACRTSTGRLQGEGRSYNPGYDNSREEAFFEAPS